MSTNTPDANKNTRRPPRRKQKRRRNHRRNQPRVPHVRKTNRADSLLQNPPNYPINPSSKSSRRDVAGLNDYLTQLPEKLVSALYKSTGGQPSRVGKFDRIVQLTVKALGQDSRIKTVIKDLKPNQLNSLITLVQCGGIAHHSELLEELIQSYGGRQRDWEQALLSLGKLGLVARSATENTHFFYIIPEPLLPLLKQALQKELTLPTFTHEGVTTDESRTLPAPFEFSLTSLAGYLYQKPARLTQQQDFHKQDKDELHGFFSQLWTRETEVFDFLLHFLLSHGMLSFQGMEVSVNPDVFDEWLGMSQADRTSLVMAKLNEDFSLAEWLLWVINQSNGDWVPAHPLRSLYRRWMLGDRWRKLFYSDDWSVDEAMPDSPHFTALLKFGFIEKGVWGQEYFYRLTEQTLSLIRPTSSEDVHKFYLTPNFEIVAPMGISTQLLFKLSELAEFTSCDRANTYKVTVHSIERAKNRGWTRDEVLRFFERYSQLGIPENVLFTLKKWLGKQPVAQFHDVLLLTVHRNFVRHFESDTTFKPFIVHRFMPGLYAIHPEKKNTLEALMKEHNIEFGEQTLDYPQGGDVQQEKNLLSQQITEASEIQMSLRDLASPTNIQPHEICFITEEKRKDEMAPSFNRNICKSICEEAIEGERWLHIQYSNRNAASKWVYVYPEKLNQSPNGKWVLVGKTPDTAHSLNFAIHKITSVEITDAPSS